LGPHPAGSGHPLLGFWAGALHFLRVGAWPAATATLHRRCRIFERIPFLPAWHPAASRPPDSGRVTHAHRARWPDDHDGCRHLQLVLHSRSGHAAGHPDDPSKGRVLSLPAGRYRADRLPDNTRIASRGAHSAARRKPVGARPDPYRCSGQQLRLLVASRDLCYGHAPRRWLVARVYGWPPARRRGLQASRAIHQQAPSLLSPNSECGPRSCHTFSCRR
jgi:hypothetical protein